MSEIEDSATRGMDRIPAAMLSILVVLAATVPSLGQLPGQDSSHWGTPTTRPRAATRPAKPEPPMIHVPKDMKPEAKEEAITAAQDAVTHAAADLEAAMATADQRAVSSPSYQRLLATSNAAAAQAAANQGTREQQQAAASAADEASKTCEWARANLARNDKDVLAKRNELRLQRIKLWSLSALDLLEGISKPRDFTKGGVWTFKGDTLVGENLDRTAAAIVFPTELPNRYVLRIEMGPCNMQFFDIMVPAGADVGMIQFGALSFSQPQTIAIFVDASSQTPIASMNGGEILWQKFPTALEGFPRRTSGIVIASTEAPFYSVLAIPCQDMDEANAIVAEPVFLGAKWTGSPKRPGFSDTNANGSHTLVPHGDDPDAGPEYHPIFRVGNLGPVNR